MRADERFVAECLVSYLRGPDKPSIMPGENPPDFYLVFPSKQIAVEVTRLAQFTFDPDGNLANRTTQDSFGIRLLEDLNRTLGPGVPSQSSLNVGLELPVSNPSRYKAAIRELVRKFIAAAKPDETNETLLEGATVRMHLIPRRATGKAIVGYVSNKHASADIAFNAHVILRDRISEKIRKCGDLKGPIWLALLNDYWLADADSYKAVARDLTMDHPFERIFFITQQGTVEELQIGAAGTL